MERDKIIKLHEKLKYLEDMERFIKNQNEIDRGSWLRIKSPSRDFKFLDDDDIRQNFKSFVNMQIKIISEQLERV